MLKALLLWPVNGNIQEQHREAPWYLGLMQGVAGWFAALLFLLFLGSFSWLFTDQYSLWLLLLGVGLCLAAFIILRSLGRHIFWQQAGLLLSLAGQFCVLWAVLDLFSMSASGSFFLMAGFQLLLFWLIPLFLHRVLSSWFAVTAFFWGMEQAGLVGFGVVLSAPVFVLLWMNEQRWGAFRPLWLAAGYGLAIALVQFCLFQLGVRQVLISTSVAGDWLVVPPWVSSACLMLALGLLVYWQLRRLDVALTSPGALACWLGALLVVALGQVAFGSSVGVLLLLTGVATGRTQLQALGLVALLGFLSWYYYQLEQTLLFKAGVLVVTGICMLLAAALVRWLGKMQMQKMTVSSGAGNVQGAVVFVSALLALVLVNYTIYQKEQVLESGKRVVLELAPVDPRSLMQGDYMALEFALARKIAKERPQTLHKGYARVTLDENAVASLAALSATLPETLADNEAVLFFRVRGLRVYFGTNAFFFQEGKASQYDAARYGEFRTAPDGEPILSSLLDENFTLLGRNDP